MASIARVYSSITCPKVFPNASESPKPHPTKLNSPWSRSTTQFKHGRMYYIRPVAAAPDQLSGKVEESIKAATEACSENPVSGECAAAWDEVEELSAAVSHAKDKKEDPLETYCKDNPETDECRTYDD
ncbi:hypothetical protein ACJIZ3_011554 [Penstemon smallii]|uniref:CP12 domain-containing protein n=1 Tax=Penstemon smallii TaxID=265156 RepID=A0ABD3UKR0_9LAMI